MQTVGILLGFLASAYAFGVICMYIFQRKLMYKPDADMLAPATYNLDMKEHHITTEDGLDVKVWSNLSKRPELTIAYFHGNAENISTRVHKFRAFMEAGYNVIAVSYRGYGGSEGKPTEQGLYCDARATLAFLTKQAKEQERNHEAISHVLLYGESMGTAVATQMALEHPNARALILEAPFPSIYARAQ